MQFPHHCTKCAVWACECEILISNFGRNLPQYKEQYNLGFPGQLSALPVMQCFFISFSKTAEVAY